MAKTSLVNEILKFFLSTLLFLILILPILPIFVLFFIYRLAIYTILRIKFGSKFWGLLSGMDMLFSLEGRSNNTVCSIITVRTKSNFEDFIQKFRKQVKTKILENPQQFTKLLTTRHKALGFYYLLKDQVEIDDCVRTLKVETKNEEICREELLTQLDKCFNDILPHENTYLWEILICEKPFKCNKASNKTQKTYAILARFHHSLGDGISVFKCFIELFADSNQYENFGKFQEPSQNSLICLLTKFQDLLFGIFLVLMTPIAMFTQAINQEPEINSLFLPKLTTENFLVAKVEETSECVKIIKDVKKRHNATFSEVLFSAISRSFSNYFQKENKDPNLTSITASTTVILKKSQLSLGKSLKIRNDFSFITVKIPIIFREDNSSSTNSDMETLEAVKKEFEDAKNSYDWQIFPEFIKFVCSLFPTWMITRILGTPALTLFITNMPGTSLITAWDGSLIEDITIWASVIEPTGLMVLIFSYDDRLQIALTVNKALISQREDAQSLVDGIHRAIIDMDSNV